MLEAVRAQMSSLVESNPKLERNKEKMGPGLDFISSAIATICCSVVSTPQMMITDVSTAIILYFRLPQDFQSQQNKCMI